MKDVKLGKKDDRTYTAKELQSINKAFFKVQEDPYFGQMVEEKT